MIHSTIEDSLAETCPNCGKDHDAKFFSLFLEDMHYIIGDCSSCGYRIEFRKDDLGGGLFMPDGEVTTVHETFKKSSVGHMKERLNGSVQPMTSSFSAMKLRFLDNVPIREERERH